MSVSLISQRVFFNSTDISVAVSDFRAGSYGMTCLTTDYVYIGATAPFNNIWIDFTSPASPAVGTPIIEARFGQQWKPVVDIMDQTAGMSISGRISWSLSYLSGWEKTPKSETVGITGSNVYDRYWLRISWPVDFEADIAYIGQKFSDDSILESYYPDLLKTDIMAGYKAGKTNWNEQHFMASDAILKDLRKRNIIVDKSQVFDWQAFEEASCHKVAEIAYSAFGAAYNDHVIRARKRYEEEMNMKGMNIDTDLNGVLSERETRDNQGWMTR